MMDFCNHTSTHPMHYPVLLCLVSCVTLCKLIHFVWNCVYVSNLRACAFGVKCRLMFILLCVGTQIALLSSIALIDSTTEKAPMVEAHTLTMLFCGAIQGYGSIQ